MERRLSSCLLQIFSGERQLVSFDHVASVRGILRGLAKRDELQALHDHRDLAEAVQPLLQRLQVAEAAEIPGAWLSLEKAAKLLGELLGELEDGSLLAAGRDLLAPRGAMLMEEHHRRLQRFRLDPSCSALPPSSFSQILADLPQWHEHLQLFVDESRARYRFDCSRTLEAVAKGAPSEIWAQRLFSSVQVEQIIGQHCPSQRSFAAICAGCWLQQSLPVLPWLLLQMLLPAMDAGHTLEVVKRLRKALEHCDDADALVNLRDAFVKGCSMLLRTAWCREMDYAQAVSWLSRALSVADEACRILLPELPPSSVAAALAAASLETPVPPTPWEAVVDPAPPAPPSAAPFSAPKMEDLSYALAQAVHEEVMALGAGASDNSLATSFGWPGRLAPLLLLFRILPDAGGSPLQAQARLVALRALQALDDQARQMEQRLLGFLQNECGHQHPLLRHLAKVLSNGDDVGDGGAGSAFRAVGVPLVAAEHLGLPTDEGPASPWVTSQQHRWAQQYLVKFPHRKLLWAQNLGVVQLLWRHGKGQTLLTTSERQAHFLLALEANTKQALDGDLASLQGVVLDVSPETGALRVRAAADAERLDLRVVPQRCAARAQELVSRSQETAPVVDAALVRILKRFHVLTGDEILKKLSSYPNSVADLQDESSAALSVAFSDARAAAQDGGREAFHRLCALCDRGLLRAETMESTDGETVAKVAAQPSLMPGDDFLQRRFFYEA